MNVYRCLARMVPPVLTQMVPTCVHALQGGVDQTVPEISMSVKNYSVLTGGRVLTHQAPSHVFVISVGQDLHVK